MAILEPQEVFFTNFEGKQQNKFLMYIDGIPSYLLRSVQRPNWNFETTIYDHINMRRKQKGKITWNPISVTIYDAVAPSGAQAVMEWFKLHHDSVTGRDGYQDFYKKDITVHVIDGNNAVIEEWIIKGAWIQSSNMGQLDWTQSEKLEIELTLEYDYAVLTY